MMWEFLRRLYGRFRVWYADRALRRAGCKLEKSLVKFWKKNRGHSFYPVRGEIMENLK